MPRFRSLGIVALLFLFCLAPTWAQHEPIPHPSGPDDHTEMEQDMQKNARTQQQKKRVVEMQRDSQRLLDLATELKHYVDQSGANILSMDVVRKAEEMEKLCRRVKENMRAN